MVFPVMRAGSGIQKTTLARLCEERSSVRVSQFRPEKFFSGLETVLSNCQVVQTKREHCCQDNRLFVDVEQVDGLTTVVLSDRWLCHPWFYHICGGFCQG